MKQRTYRKWTEEEVSHLKKMLGRVPFNLIPQKFNNYLKRKNLPKRTKKSIQAQACKIANSVKTERDNWTIAGLASILGINRSRVEFWCHSKGLKYEKYSARDLRITKVNLREFAAKSPESLGGIDPKKLNKVLKDTKLVSAITKVTSYAPKKGRKLTIVRLDTGDVYPGAGEAAIALAPEIDAEQENARALIYRVCRGAKSKKENIDFFQLDYPLFWVPAEVRAEFNFLAGKILYELYLEICEKVGYEKMSCLTVAARLAVEITLLAFKVKDSWLVKNHPKKDEPRSAIADYYANRLKKKLFYVYQLSPSYTYEKIGNIIRFRLKKHIYAASKGNLVDFERYLEEFIVYYIDEQSTQFYRKSFVPRGYKPRTRLEKADYWAYIYHSLNIHITVGSEGRGTKKTIPWLVIKWMKFQKEFTLESTQPPTTRFIEGWQAHDCSI